MTDDEKTKLIADIAELEKYVDFWGHAAYASPEFLLQIAKLARESLHASQQPADDGWIEWAGDIGLDEQPVEGMVEVNFRNGVISKRNAGQVAWHHEGLECDIIAYRVVKP